MRLFGDTAFMSDVAGIFLQSASLTALVFTAQFFQDAQGDSPLVAGLRLLPLGVVPLALGRWSGTSADRVCTWPMIVIGMALQMAGSTISALFSDPGLGYPVLAVAMAVVAVGFTCAVPALTNSVVGSVEPADIGTASGMFSTVRQVGDPERLGWVRLRRSGHRDPLSSWSSIAALPSRGDPACAQLRPAVLNGRQPAQKSGADVDPISRPLTRCSSFAPLCQPMLTGHDHLKINCERSARSTLSASSQVRHKEGRNLVV